MRTTPYVTPDTITEKSEIWIRRIRENIPSRPWLQVIPEHCCLMVIDMLRYFAHAEGRCYLPASAAIVPRVRRILELWRKRGNCVIYTRHCHSGDDLGMLGRFYSDHIRCDEEDSNIIKELYPQAHETVIRKTTYDAFRGTDLEAVLRERQVRQLLITGVLTHMCCETTARSAFCRGFEVYVVADGQASSCEERHYHSLAAQADCLGILVSTEEIVGRWNECMTSSS